MFIAEEGEGNQYANKLPKHISEDELTANISVEDETQGCAERRRNATERQRRIQHDNDAEFVPAREEGFRMPITNITLVASLLVNSQDHAAQKALLLTQKAWLQLNR
jgi:hypothetical protein